MKSNNKVYIALILIMIAFFFLMYFFIGKDQIRKEKENLTLLLGEDTVWTYKNQRWYIENENVDEYNWQKFQVFLDGKYQKEYYVWHDDKFYIFNDQKESVNYTENFLALQSNFEVLVKEFTTIDIDDRGITNKYLSQNNISSSADLTVNTKTSIDIDNDGKDENIYIVSNAFPMEFDPDTIFSYVFMEKDGKLYDIYKFEEKNYVDNGFKPYINQIIDVDNDKQYELIISCAGYSISETKNLLFKFNGTSFEQLI